MPRVALSPEQKIDYKLKDLKRWVTIQMGATGKTQKDVGDALGLSQSRVSQMLKRKGDNVEKDPFSYGQILILCEFFGVDGEAKERLLTL